MAYLDDKLAKKHKCRDFVDTRRFTSDGEKFGEELILNTVLGAVDRIVDEKRIG